MSHHEILAALRAAGCALRFDRVQGRAVMPAPKASACARQSAAQKSAPGGGETPAGRVHNRAVGVA